MLRISKTTKRPSTEIIQTAERFFGAGGEGLEPTGRNDCCVSFAGAGGHVAVGVSDDGKQRTVDVEAREFEFQARKFLDRL